MNELKYKLLGEIISMINDLIDITENEDNTVFHYKLFDIHEQLLSEYNVTEYPKYYLKIQSFDECTKTVDE
jgi:hypothetical protein